MDELILDTCVLLDIFLTTRPRHKLACKLLDYIRSKNIRVTLPMISLFELKTALAQEKATNSKLEFNSAVNQNTTFQMKTINIDEAFFEKYFDSSLPYLKAGDTIFFAIAAKDKIPLVTEDKQLLQAGRQTGIEVYDIQTFLATKNSN